MPGGAHEMNDGTRCWQSQFALRRPSSVVPRSSNWPVARFASADHVGLQKAAHQRGNYSVILFEREMAGVKEMEFQVLEVSLYGWAPSAGKI
jgi:hypothetical protein